MGVLIKRPIVVWDFNGSSYSGKLPSTFWLVAGGAGLRFRKLLFGGWNPKPYTVMSIPLTPKLTVGAQSSRAEDLGSRGG